ncbi:MAG: hypothetical protein Q4E05_08070 [Pseudoclavibacter sp.]|nr:hypothetical protein [Pseudoclavibacter sp.]
MPAVEEPEPSEQEARSLEAGEASDGTQRRIVRTVEEPAVLRRQVRLGRFLAIGAIAGILAALALTFAVPERPGFVPANPDLHFSQTQVFGFLLVFLVPIGLGLGGVAGLLVGRLGARPQRVTLARTEVRFAEEDDAEERGEDERPGPDGPA